MISKQFNQEVRGARLRVIYPDGKIYVSNVYDAPMLYIIAAMFKDPSFIVSFLPANVGV